MIHLPSKPEVQDWKRGQIRPLDLHERIAYAHTLAHHLASKAIEHGGRFTPDTWDDRAWRICCETWRRYDRVTRFLYAHTAMY